MIGYILRKIRQWNDNRYANKIVINGVYGPNQRKWLDALVFSERRYGVNWCQGYRYLTSDDRVYYYDLPLEDPPVKYCVLGVACRVLKIPYTVNRNTGRYEYIFDHSTSDKGIGQRDLHRNKIGPDNDKLLGMYSPFGHINLKDVVWYDRWMIKWWCYRCYISLYEDTLQLTVINDRFQWSFRRIGRFILRNPRAVFRKVV